MGGMNQDMERKVIRLGELTSWEPQREGQVRTLTPILKESEQAGEREKGKGGLLDCH